MNDIEDTKMIKVIRMIVKRMNPAKRLAAVEKIIIKVRTDNVL